MLFKDIIRHKRDGGELDSGQIEAFVGGLADGSLPPEQIAALAMAIFLRSMSPAEAGRLTLAMAASGTVLQWDDGGGPVIDKHSTGGVGDKVSLMLAPIAAACGLRVPMISGRGLGHTGGTLDKVEVIPGYNATPPLEKFRATVAEAGCAIIGQTPELAPADRRLYAIRDVTGTVESVPLITASILSKKMAAGNQGLVMDVKVGSGAFMRTPVQARELARSIAGIASAAELPTRTLLTDMNQPLGLTVGNGLEMAEAVAYLRNETREARLDEVTLGLAAEMLTLGGLADSDTQARQKAEDVLRSGQAAETFGRMVSALGGPHDFVERCDRYLPHAMYEEAVMAPEPGYLAGVDTRAVGNALIELGGGRREAGDRLDLSVGFSRIAPVGAQVDDAGRPLAVVHAQDADAAARAIALYIDACRFASSAPEPGPIVLERLLP